MHIHRADHRRPAGTSFVGSFLDDTDQPMIVLRGRVDAAVVERLAVHVGSMPDPRPVSETAS